MKFKLIMSGLACVVALTGCGSNSADTKEASAIAQAQQEKNTIRQPSVSGQIYLQQGKALPAGAVLTVTLSDASQAGAPSKILSQRVIRTSGEKFPSRFVLPFNPSDIRQGARILLSAAITLDGKVIFNSEAVKPVISNGSKEEDLLLVPLTDIAVPASSQNQPGITTSSPSSASQMP